jgi:pimeloyl-ACP methyl ester carboxylesterase
MHVRIALAIGLVVLSGLARAKTAIAADGSVVGERILHVIDSSRTDPLASGHLREWMVTLLYPASAPANSAREHYIADNALLTEMLRETQDEAIGRELRQSAALGTDIVVNARPTSSQYPLVLLSPGYGEVGRLYVYLACAIVNKGFAVALVDHPYLGLVRLPDGRFLRAPDDPNSSNSDPGALRPEINGWTRDLSVVLDRLFESQDKTGVRLDFRRVAAAGHSTGGTIALDACGRDPRVRACMDFDGTPDGSQTQIHGPGGPTLVVLSSADYSDDDLKRLGRTREAQNERREAVLSALEGVLIKGTGPGWIATVQGGGHMSFSDAPQVSPSQLRRFGGAYMIASRSQEVYAALTTTFARAYFPGGSGGEALKRFQTNVSEVTFIAVPKINDRR